MLYIITGPTLSGKTTLVDNLVTSTGIKKIVTYTNRDIRKNERNHIDYHFVTTKELDNDDLICKRVFYTKNRVEPYIYALDKNDLLSKNDLILIIDPLGIREIKDYLGKDSVTTVYIDASESLIRERARKRGDSIDEVNRRLSVDRDLFVSAPYFADIVLDADKDDMLQYMYNELKGRVHNETDRRD